MAQELLIFNASTSTFESYSTTSVQEATFEDNGQKALDILRFSVTNDVKGTSFDPSYNRQIKFLSDSGSEVFGGRVQRKVSDNPFFVAETWSYGQQFLDRYVQKVYDNQTVEYIVEDLITTYTDLTYASTSTTGITIDDRITFRDKTVAEVISQLASTVDFYFYTDAQQNAYFEPLGAQSTSVTLDVVNDDRVIFKPIWDFNTQKIVTRVTVIGERQNFEDSETFTASASQTEFTIAEEPAGQVKVTVDGAEQDPIVDGSTTGDYEVDVENKKIIFESGLTGGESVVIFYSYLIPIKVTSEANVLDDDGNKIIKEEIIVNKSLKTYTEARRFAKQFLDKYSTPETSADIPIRGFIDGVQSGKTIKVIDTIEGINQNFLVEKVTFEYSTGTGTISVGPVREKLMGWQSEVQRKIREIFQENTNSEKLQEYVNIPMRLNIDTEAQIEYSLVNPTNSFILGHVTLGRLRTDADFEADCSNNGNNGTWNGTGIGGSQFETVTVVSDEFVTPVHRLGCGNFNGTDNTVTSSGVSESGCRSVVFFINNEGTTEGLMQFNGGATISIDGSGNVTTSGFTNATVTEESLTNSTFVYVEFDSETLTNPTFGYDGTNYFSGKGDELKVFDTTLTSSDREDIKNKFFDEFHSKYGNCKLWWSFDNPLLGDRRTTKILQESTET